MIRPPAAMLLLFSWTPHDALAHATRSRLMKDLQARPGLTVGELATTLDLSYKTLAHHARVLERGGHIVVVRDGRVRRCFPARGQASSRDAALGPSWPPSRFDP